MQEALRNRVLEAIKLFYSQRKAMPTAESVAKKFKIEESEARECLNEVRPSNESLEKNTNSGERSTPPREKPTRVARGPRTSKSLPTRSDAETKSSRLWENLRAFLRVLNPHNLITKNSIQVLWAILAIISAWRSFGYIYAWFARLDTPINAWISALLFTAITFILPLTILIVLKQRERKYRLLISLFLAILFVPTMSFSMAATVGGIYESHSSLILANSQEETNVKAAKESIVRLEASIEDAKKSKALAEAELAQRLATQRNYEVGSREYNRLANNIAESKSRIGNLENDINKSSERISELSTSVPATERHGFFPFIDGMLSLKPGSTEFYTSLVVAIVLDIVGPVAAIMGYFL